MGERRGRVIKEHVYKGPMDKDNGVAGLNVEGGWVGQERAMGENEDSCN